MTLLIFAIVFLAFLLAPIALLAVAGLAYVVMRPRSDKTQSSGPGTAAGVANHGFGAGAQ